MTAADTRRLAAHLRHTADRIEHELDRARQLARDWRTPTHTPDGPTPINQISDPTGTAATTTRRDPVTNLAADLDRNTRRLAAACTDTLAALDLAHTPHDTRPTGTAAIDDVAGSNRTDGYCTACNGYAAGTTGDRLRPVRGFRLCDACRKAWARLVESGDVTYGDIDQEFAEFVARRATRTERTP